jgi:hypothetical protein
MPFDPVRQALNSKEYKDLNTDEKIKVAGHLFDDFISPYVPNDTSSQDQEIIRNNFIKNNAVPWYDSIGAAAGRGFSGSMSGIARHLGYDDAADRLNNVKTQLSNELYQPDRATSDAPLTTKASALLKEFGTGAIEMTADPISTAAMAVTGGIGGFLAKGLLSTGIESIEAAPSVLGAAQRLLNNPITASLNPTVRGIATGVIEGAAGMNGYNATQSYMQGTKYSPLESTGEGAAFGLGGALLGKAFSKLTGNGADWNTANSSDVQRATESARGQANTTLAKAAEDAKNAEELKQAQATQQAQQQQADIQNAVQLEVAKKAQYDAMPFEDKLNAQPEANIETVPMQDANGNIIPDRPNEPSIYNNMKNNADMEDEISKLPPDQQQAARDYLDKRSKEQNNPITNNVNADGSPKALEDKVNDITKDNSTPEQNINDGSISKDWEPNVLKKNDLLNTNEALSRLDEQKKPFGEASIEEKFSRATDLTKQMEDMKQKIKENSDSDVSDKQAEDEMLNYFKDNKSFEDAQAIRNAGKNADTFETLNKPEAKTTPSEDMKKLNELSQNPHFDEHLNERENIQAKDITNSQKLVSKRQGNLDYQTGALYEPNYDARFGITSNDVKAIRKAQVDGKMNDTASKALNNLSHDLELRSREHSKEYVDKKINTLFDAENQHTIGDTTLDRRRLSALNKISKADEMTGEGQRQIDDGIKELNDVKAERDKIIVKDWSDAVGSDKEVKEFADNLNLAKKIIDC